MALADQKAQKISQDLWYFLELHHCFPIFTSPPNLWPCQRVITYILASAAQSEITHTLMTRLYIVLLF